MPRREAKVRRDANLLSTRKTWIIVFIALHGLRSMVYISMYSLSIQPTFLYELTREGYKKSCYFQDTELNKIIKKKEQIVYLASEINSSSILDVDCEKNITITCSSVGFIFTSFLVVALVFDIIRATMKQLSRASLARTDPFESCALGVQPNDFFRSAAEVHPLSTLHKKVFSIKEAYEKKINKRQAPIILTGDK